MIIAWWHALICAHTNREEITKESTIRCDQAIMTMVVSISCIFGPFFFMISFAHTVCVLVCMCREHAAMLEFMVFASFFFRTRFFSVVEHIISWRPLDWFDRRFRCSSWAVNGHSSMEMTANVICWNMLSCLLAFPMFYMDSLPLTMLLTFET